MDDQGRLHIGKFVGDTFEATGIAEEKKLELAAEGGGMNRKQRRAAAKLERQGAAA